MSDGELRGKERCRVRRRRRSGAGRRGGKRFLRSVHFFHADIVEIFTKLRRAKARSVMADAFLKGEFWSWVRYVMIFDNLDLSNI